MSKVLVEIQLFHKTQAPVKSVCINNDLWLSSINKGPIKKKESNKIRNIFCIVSSHFFSADYYYTFIPII